MKAWQRLGLPLPHRRWTAAANQSGSKFALLAARRNQCSRFDREWLDGVLYVTL